ncbi:CAAD domain-containing protein [Leptolyngbya sp. FACHB-261]|uniref:CAAD domain-containing protein n=1 Tax=Leptolyngbya sp. FACHB-261 TaxID=2692806 RepID=UPI001687AFA6|nr:CAAD domain-containing protein [Leptolyngbya sp. FACHB-261]MBD2102130.1 hypothetical protein [Leptolyngbya sp. FACHB-261]
MPEPTPEPNVTHSDEPQQAAEVISLDQLSAVETVIEAVHAVPESELEAALATQELTEAELSEVTTLVPETPESELDEAMAKAGKIPESKLDTVLTAVQAVEDSELEPLEAARVYSGANSRTPRPTHHKSSGFESPEGVADTQAGSYTEPEHQFKAEPVKAEPAEQGIISDVTDAISGGASSIKDDLVDLVDHPAQEVRQSEQPVLENTMNTEAKSTYAVADAQQPEAVNVQPPTAAPLATVPAAEATTERRLIRELLAPFAYIPEGLSHVVNQYKTPLTVFALVLVLTPVLSILSAILGVINSTPLLAPTFELVGASYTVWFVYRYLLFASNRQELNSNIRSFKNQVLGESAE